MSEAAEVPGIWESLRRRKLVQWTLAYAAAAWLVLQVLALAASAFEWPAGVLRIATLVAIVGFVLALVLAWYHGERGAQRISGPELLILAAVLGTGGLLLWRAAPPGHEAVEAARATDEPAAAPAEASIAVLPLANLSGDPAQEYFSDGMSEELLNVLAKVPGLRVAARTSSFQFKGRNLDIQDIARQLNVATVLEGSLRKSGTRVRITAQLIDASNGFHLWSETYDRELDDIFAVQDEIAGMIAGKLREHLGLAPDAGSDRSVARTANTEAYDAYLRGRELLLRRSRASVADGLAALQQAVALDPDYAPAWAQLATAYFLSRRAGTGYGDMEPQDGERLAKEALATAQRLNPQLDEVYAVEGVVRQFFHNDLDGALAALDRAIALNPANVQARHWRIDLLQRSGRFRDGVEERIAIARVDPLFGVNNSNLVHDLTLLGRRAEAAPYLARVSDPSSRLYAGARAAAFDFDATWDEAALVHLAGLDADPEDWARKGSLANRLLLLGLADAVADGIGSGWDFADLTEAVRGDWSAAVDAFDIVDEESIPKEFWYYRRAQHLYRAGRDAAALAQFDAVWPNVWPYGVADDVAYVTPRRLWYAQALRDAGRAGDVEPVVQVARDEVAAARRDGLQGPVVDLLEAELAAWDGDRATALRLLPRGLMAEPFLSTIESDPIYAPLGDEAAFLAAVAGERARRAQLLERFLREACARPASAAWHPPATACAQPETDGDG